MVGIPITHDLGEVIRNENPSTEESRAKPGRIIAFVNYYYTPDVTIDLCTQMFWGQIEAHQPESYISDGAAVVTFVSRNPHHFEAVLACFALD